MPEPLYTAGNCRIAYQLRWSLTAFGSGSLPPEDQWRSALSAAIEPDGVRLLEVNHPDASTYQFLLSTKPDVAPPEAVRSVKGRLQHLLRESHPKLWQRQYSIKSVGDANSEVLDHYVGRQSEHHPMADARVTKLLSQAQFHDPTVDLGAFCSGSHGYFTHSVHIVLENAGHLPDTRENWLARTQAMVIGVCRKKEWLFSRLALVSNHLHLLVGCGVAEAPREVALSLMNNLAFAHGMKPVFEFSFYVGTFGPYDHGVIRRKIASLEAKQ